MTKLKILALVVGMVMLFAIPSVAMAQQPQLPHLFIGSADGAEVTAWVDGAQIASATIANGAYTITVDPGTDSWGGKTVSFQIDGNDAAETATFVHGGADELNLTAGAMIATPEPTEAPVAEVVVGMPGPAGVQGPQGRRGAKGADGATGDAGSAGATGSAGSAGAKGSTGAAGATGSAGPAGPQAAAGNAGPPGATGTAGAAGDDGSSLLGIIALILAIIALVGAGGAFMMGRRT